MGAVVIDLLAKFRERSRQQALTVDLLREAIDSAARRELGMSAHTPYPEMTIAKQNALTRLKDDFRYEIAARLLETGSAAQLKVASALLAEITHPRDLSPASGTASRRPGGTRPGAP
jgi:hypothetical protein